MSSYIKGERIWRCESMFSSMLLAALALSGRSAEKALVYAGHISAT